MLDKLGAIFIVIIMFFLFVIGIINLGLMFWFNIWLGLLVFILGNLLFSDSFNNFIISTIAAYALVNQHDWHIFHAILFAFFPIILDLLTSLFFKKR